MPISQVCAGDAIVVHTGSVIPLDGRVLDGEASVNQASLTGEAEPVRKGEGAVVYAGTVVEEGQITVTVEQQAGNGRYDQIVKMIENSEKLKSASETRAAALADKLVPYSLLGTAVTYALTRNATRAISILMVDFPVRSSCRCRWPCCPPCVSAAATISRSRAASIWRLWPTPIPSSLTRPAR